MDQLAALYQPTSMLTIENNQVVGAANIVAKYKVRGHSLIGETCKARGVGLFVSKKNSCVEYFLFVDFSVMLPLL